MRQRLAALFPTLGLFVCISVPALAQQDEVISPRLPTTADRITIRLPIGGCLVGYSGPFVQGNTLHITTQQIPISECPPDIPSDEILTFPQLAAGAYTISLEEEGGIVLERMALEVREPATSLALVIGRFSASLAQGGSAAQAVQLTDQSGYFWFFDSGNPEVTVKIIDGRGINGHFWLFAAGLTDRAFTLTVTDTSLPCFLGAPLPATCPTRLYTNPAGTHQNLVDLQAF